MLLVVVLVGLAILYVSTTQAVQKIGVHHLVALLNTKLLLVLVAKMLLVISQLVVARITQNVQLHTTMVLPILQVDALVLVELSTSKPSS